MSATAAEAVAAGAPAAAVQRRHLYRNGIALFANSLLSAALGWAFWVVLARRADQATVGAASASVAALTGLSAVAQLGLGSLLVVYLPRSGSSAARLVGSAFAVGVFTSLAFGVGYVMIAGEIATELRFHTVAGGAAFALSVAVWSLFTLQDNAYTGLRKAVWVPLENSAYGMAKLLAVAFTGTLSVGAVVAAWIIPAAIAVVPMSAWLFARLLPEHVRRHHGAADLQGWRGYLARDSISLLLGQLATATMPVLVLARLGADTAAVFGIVWMLAQALDLLTVNMGMSLIVEGAHARGRLRHMHTSLRRRVVPAAATLAVLISLTSPFVLGIFGRAYTHDGPLVLSLLLIGVVIRSFTVLEISAARGRRDAGTVLILQGVGAAVVPALAWFLAAEFGVAGAGAAYLIGQVAVAFCALVLSARRKQDLEYGV
jgi:O-antigen/teichoic acid export membrane protein